MCFFLGNLPQETIFTMNSASRRVTIDCDIEGDKICQAILSVPRQCLQHLVGWPRLKPPRCHHTWPPAAAASVATTSRSYIELLLYNSRHGCAQAWRREDIGEWERLGPARSDARSPAASTGCARRREWEWKWKETGWTSFKEYESAKRGGKCE